MHRRLIAEQDFIGTVNKIVQKATAFKAKNPIGSKRYSPHPNVASVDEVNQLLDERSLASDLSALISSGLNGLADIDVGGMCSSNSRPCISVCSHPELTLCLHAKDVNNVLSVLIAKKRQMILEEKGMEAQILKEFLLKVKKQKQQVSTCWILATLMNQICEY